jgi:hypothetical protein
VSDAIREHLCVVCPQLRPDLEPRIFDRAQVCDGCRARLRSLLVEIAELYADLDLEKPRSTGARVSGSRSAPLPLVLSSLDLSLPAGGKSVSDDLVPLFERSVVEVRVWTRTGSMTTVVMSQKTRRRDNKGILAWGASGDQVGDPSVASVLDSWARDWQSYRWALLPDPTVAALTWWLGERLEWACEDHPAVDDFAAEISDLACRMRPHGPRAELKLGVPCRSCDMTALYQWPGSDRVECGNCPALLTDEEYARWTQLLAMPAHQPWVRDVVAAQRAESQSGP